MNYSEELTIFTDGSALNNSKESPAGYAFYIPCIKHLKTEGLFCTNNQAELNACKFALYYVYKHLSTLNKFIKNNNIYFITDSKYCINSLTNKYKNKLNIELIEECKQSINNIQKNNYNVLFVHVEAHTNKNDFLSYNNNIVDQAARESANKMRG